MPAVDAGAPCDDPASATFGCSVYTHCVGGTCESYAGGGSACDPAIAGCMLDLWCNVGKAAPTCDPQSPAGGPCSDIDSCQDMASCDGGSANPDGGPWLLGACLSLPQLNDPCLATCVDGLRCDPFSQRCVALKPNGGPCSSTLDCQSGVCTQGQCGLCP